MRTKKNHINMAVVISALVLCMTMLGEAGYLVYTSRAVEVQLSQLEPEACVQGGTLYDPAGRQAELDDMIREGMLIFPINAIPVMENRRVEANLLIENPPDNGNRFTVSTSREDTGEGLYQSSYLGPKQHIESVPLGRELSADEYPCPAYIDVYHISGSAYVGRATVRIMLFTQN